MTFCRLKELLNRWGFFTVDKASFAYISLFWFYAVVNIHFFFTLLKDFLFQQVSDEVTEDMQSDELTGPTIVPSVPAPLKARLFLIL